MASKDYLKDKRIAVIGLGLQGELISDIRYLIKSGAIVSYYDMKSESRMKDHVTLLRSIGLMSHVCGNVPPDDLLDMDLILLSHDYDREASFLAPAKDANIPIEYPETLFFRLSPPVTFIGIMGAYGTSTVYNMLLPMLSHLEKVGDSRFFAFGCDESDGILSNLKTIKNGDVLLGRITPSLMIELSAIRISPHVAVFTSVPSREAYLNSPFEILSYQTYNNFIIGHDQVIDTAHKYGFQTKAKMIRTRSGIVPTDWDLRLRGVHDRENMALAVETARLFKIPEEIIQDEAEKWKPLKGRMEFVKKIKNIEFYNDASSESPNTTMNTLIGLASISTDSTTASVSRNNILIMGGSSNNHDYSSLVRSLGQYIHTLVLVPGSGTMKFRRMINDLENIRIVQAESLEDAVSKAYIHANKGDRIIFSPAFKSFAPEGSRKDISERFVRAVRGLK